MVRYILVILLFIISIPTQAKTILVVGDSLSAAFNIKEDTGWVYLLKNRLTKLSTSYDVVNISTSGDTTSNGLAKLSAALKRYQPTIAIIELGANDGLRGLPLTIMEQNLAMMISQAQKVHANVLLLATPLPPNYGITFLTKFNQVYKNLAAQYHVILIPMFLNGVAGHSKLMQPDGLHPNQDGQSIILDNIWPVLKSML
jgi:acyl-CoA thioesterase-1